MSTHPTPPPTKTTIFIWPTGLFPRRIIYLLRAKNITLSHLRAKNILLVPVQLTPQGLFSHPDFETRPEGSLPVMRLEHEGGKEVVWVRESLAIMGYLDDLFGVQDGHPELKGSTSIQRARSTDILSALSDIVSWGVVSLAHSNPSTTSWSGLKAEEMSAAAAAHADRKVAALMGKMDGWVKKNMATSGSSEGKKGSDWATSKSLAGPGADVTFADVAVMAQVEYMRESYGLQMIDDYESLTKWWQGMKGEGWVVGRDVLLECEKSGRWDGVLGA